MVRAMVAPGRTVPPACGFWVSTIPRGVFVGAGLGRLVAAVVDVIDVDVMSEVVVVDFPTE
jgi:hypothetical protein